MEKPQLPNPLAATLTPITQTTKISFETTGNMKEYYGTGFSEKYGKRIMFVAERPTFKKSAQKDLPRYCFDPKICPQALSTVDVPRPTGALFRE